MNLNLLEICDEIFRSQRLPIHGRTVTPNQVAFLDFPCKGLTTTAEDRLGYWTIYVQDPFGGRVYTKELTLPVLPVTVESVLRFIYEELTTYLDQPPPYDGKPSSKPEITLKIDEYTPTVVLETLAAMALGWVMNSEGYWASKEGVIQANYRDWTPLTSSDQTLQLAAEMNLKVSGNSPAEIRFNITLAAAQKYVQGI